MRSSFALALAIGATSVLAADDLTVLKSAPKETPRKLLHSYLIAECQKYFDVRKAEVDNLKTPEAIAARQSVLKQKFIDALGGFPGKTPLNARVVGALKRDGYRIEKVIYESRPEHHVTANLYIPEGTGHFPGVLMPIGHSQNGKAAEYMQRGAILLARNGFVALVYDPIGQGERSQLLDKLGRPAIKGSTSEHTMCGIGALLVGRSTASYRVWDGIRSLDYLVSRPEVDARKIGCTGCSGGGTLTSYLMALDDRIQAAAPSCYITSLERLFATIGPQDAEQNITGQVAIGLDHADYILLRAPKPILLCAATRDFFDIKGTWDSFREAKRIYTKLGFPERIELIESDTSHGYPRSHREAMARFFSRWLKGEDKAIVESDWAIEKDADLQCTRSGQVLEDLRGKSVFDLNAELAARLAKHRAGMKRTSEELRSDVVKVLGLPEVIPGARVSEHGLVSRSGVVIKKRVYSSPNGIPLPALILEPKDGIPQSPLIVFIHDEGSIVAAAPDGPAMRLAKAGRRVLAIDLRGFGETAAGAPSPGTGPPFGVDFKESFLSLHLNRPLLGQRVADLITVLRASAGESKTFELIGIGSAAPVALHASALDRSVSRVTLESGLISWDNVIRAPISQNQLVNAVPGALGVYDLPELAAMIAPRGLTIRNPADAAGRPLTKKGADEAYAPAWAAYGAASVPENLVIDVTARK